MQNFGKIYPNSLGIPAVGEGVFPKLKTFFRRAFPLFLLSLSAGFFLLLLQALAVGLLDRFGVSPKTSFLFSSLFYVAGFALLAVWGGGVKFPTRVRASRQPFRAVNASQPVCKILIIRREGEQK